MVANSGCGNTSTSTSNVISSFLPYKHQLHVLSMFASFPQDGSTAVLLAAGYGHKEVVQELCETFEADFLHRMKVHEGHADY